MSQAAECQQNQLFESQHLPGPAEPQPAVTVRQQAANHQQRPVRPSALHQDSVSVVNKTHSQQLLTRCRINTAPTQDWVNFNVYRWGV